MTQANIGYYTDWYIQGGIVKIVSRLKGSLEQAEQWHPGSRYKSRRNKSQMASFPNFTKIFVRRWPKRTWTLCQMKRLIMINSSGNICQCKLDSNVNSFCCYIYYWRYQIPLYFLIGIPVSWRASKTLSKFVSFILRRTLTKVK